MAIYHTRVKTFSRTQGHSSTAAAAYRAGILIPDVRTGTKHDYRRRGGVVETRLVAPDGAPIWALDPCELWGQAEASERRKDATVAREFEIALPHELDDDQRSTLTAAIARALVKRYRFAVQASIHEPQTDDGRNYHAHILATTRRIGPTGLADKTRELDGGPSGRGEVEWIRAMVAKTVNYHLAIANIDSRVDHRSLRDQAKAALDDGDFDAASQLSRIATQHVGKNAIALHRKGVECNRIQTNAEIEEANEARWQATVADLEGQGRLLPTPEAYSYEQARRKHALEATPPSIAAGEMVDQPLNDDGQLVKIDARQIETYSAFQECVDLWADGFFSTLLATFKATSTLLRHHADRLAAYVHVALFRSDVRVLLMRIKDFKRHATRFQRRLKAEDRAQHNLTQAELALERFDSDYPKPGALTRQEWARRRARRLRAVQHCRDQCRRATEATGPGAQGSYNAQALASAQELETWSQGMLKRFPVEADSRPEVAQVQMMGVDVDLKPVGLGPRPTIH